MVGAHALFDTNILIDFTHGIPGARRELLRYSSRAISIITWIEILAGVLPNQEAETRGFLTTLRIIPITSDISERAVAIRRQSRIKLPDAIILATAEVEDLLLITRNTKDFKEGNPRIRVPYKI
jgi:predicted nucleic acid-binding protein